MIYGIYLEQNNICFFIDVKFIIDYLRKKLDNYLLYFNLLNKIMEVITVNLSC